MAIAFELFSSLNEKFSLDLLIKIEKALDYDKSSFFS